MDEEEEDNMPTISELNSSSGRGLKKKWKKKKGVDEGDDYDPQDVRLEKNRLQDVRVQFDGKKVKPLLPPRRQQNQFYSGQTGNQGEKQKGGDSKRRNHNNYKNNKQSGDVSGGQNFRGGSSTRAFSNADLRGGFRKGTGAPDMNSLRNRKYRDRNKSRFANHNRKKQNAKKRQMPL